MKEAIIIFTRLPIPGQTKTRLMPHFTPQECAGLHCCFLRDIKQECVKCGRSLYVFYTPDGRRERLLPIFGNDVIYQKQKGNDLGERMLNAIRFVLGIGHESCVLIGTDIPEMRAEDINSAFCKLLYNDVVFGPTKDGGYYLVGMKRPLTEVFQKQTYGHGRVLINTVLALHKRSYRIALVKQRRDIDTPEDLRRLYMRLKQQASIRTSYTAQYLAKHLKISIIIPVYNEEYSISRLIRQLDQWKEECEVIFVDGGSTDQTLSKIPASYRVVSAAKGRAVQMNVGAKESSGDILFFLHCDSYLPDEVLAQIHRVMRRYRAGGFGVAFPSHNFFMMTNRIVSNLRMRHGIIFGDQGLFLERDLFFELGMFPEIPIMEDYQFALNMKKRGIKIGITKKRIYTSDRRYPKKTTQKLKVMWQMFHLRYLFRKGAAPKYIARMYGDIR